LNFFNVQAASLVYNTNTPVLIACTDARWIVHKVRTSIGLSEVVEAEANESEQSNQLVETKYGNIRSSIQ
ncbi:hypothetical protein, partial [Klebsiella quasipneumoniae]|uniref:hypothetical protein n=1 Tax=Klebsiella quasipneumoniae TaxID=1463165 RepID=UPI00272FF3A9